LHKECLGCKIEKKLSFCPIELVGMGFNLDAWNDLHLKKPNKKVGGLGKN
jgi:hypothetical protein